MKRSIAAILAVADIANGLSIGIDSDRIAAVYLVRNPDKLRYAHPTSPMPH